MRIIDIFILRCPNYSDEFSFLSVHAILVYMFKKIITRARKKINHIIAKIKNKKPDTEKMFPALLFAGVGIMILLPSPFFGVQVALIKNIAIIFFGIVLLLTTTIQSLIKGSFRIPDKFTLGSLLLIITSLILASFSSPALRTALFGNLTEAPLSFVILFSLIVIFYVAMKVITHSSRIVLFFITLGFSYTIVAIVQIVRLIVSNQTNTLIGSWVDFSVFSLVIVICVLIFLEIGKFLRPIKIVTGIVGVIALSGVFITNVSWVLFLGAGITLLFILYVFSFGYWNKKKTTFEKGRTIPWYALGVFLFFVIMIVFKGNISNTLGTIYSPINDYVPSGIATLQATKVSLKDNIILGSGIGTFDYLWNQVKSPTWSETITGSQEISTGYGFFGTLMATSGLLGVIAWMSFLILFLYKISIVVRKQHNDTSERFTKIAILFGSSMLTIVSLIHYPGTVMLMIWVIFLGGLWNLAQEKERIITFLDTPRKSFFGMIIVCLVAVVIVSFSWVVIRQTISLGYYSKSIKTLSDKKPPIESIEQLVTANKWWSTDTYNRMLTDRMFDLAKGVLSSQFSLDQRELMVSQAQDILKMSLEYAKASVQLDTKDYRNYLIQGDVYRGYGELGVEKALSLSQQAYEQAQLHSPHDSTLYLPLARLALLSGKVNEFDAIIQKSLDIHPTIGAYVLAYEKNIALKEFDLAENNLRTLITLSPNDFRIFNELGMLYLSQREYRQATNAFIKSIMKNNNQPETLALLGATYELLGDTKQSTDIFNYLKRQLPNEAEVLIIQMKDKIQSLIPKIAIPDIVQP
jgi:tetratricopeptide (TPR) repeat protein